jgi:hypothetical protein
MEHSGNQNESQEDVREITRILDELLRDGTTWVNNKGKELPLGLKDILIVTPPTVHCAKS